jgi:hypothetical protein
MNPDNYGSLEACQRLQAAGIVLETDFCWAKISNTKWIIISSNEANEMDRKRGLAIPAPSMAEVWRELPKQKTFIQKGEEFHICFLGDWKHDEGKLYHLEYRSELFYNENPTDALIDLLIWVRKEKGNAK